MTAIQIRDVGPRDGLQSERPVNPVERAHLALALAAAGLRHVEAASFVSPKAVPAMAGGAEVMAHVLTDNAVDTETTWWALVPNARGAQLALAAGVQHLTVTISASEGYSQKNVGRSTEDAIRSLAEIAEATHGIDSLHVVVSYGFGSPFDDGVSADPVISIVDGTLAVMPGPAITLADTTGTATPRRVRQVIAALAGFEPGRLGVHLHDTRGTALANALTAIELGVTRFDTAVGGLGGSPFAPGAGGNLATEDLVLVLHDLGLDTGIDLDALLAISHGLAELVGHDVPSRVSAAGPLPHFDER